MKNSNAKRIIVKLGTNLLSRPDGTVDYDYVGDICDQVAKLKSQGREVMIVTSGAIGSGMGELGIEEWVESVPKRQALAGIGQGILMKHYHDALARYEIPVAQILLTSDVFEKENGAILRAASRGGLGPRGRRVSALHCATPLLAANR